MDVYELEERLLSQMIQEVVGGKETVSILTDENWNKLAQMQKYLIENNYSQVVKFFHEAVGNIKNIQSDTDDEMTGEIADDNTV